MTARCSLLRSFLALAPSISLSLSLSLTRSGGFLDTQRIAYQNCKIKNIPSSGAPSTSCTPPRPPSPPFPTQTSLTPHLTLQEPLDIPKTLPFFTPKRERRRHLTRFVEKSAQLPFALLFRLLLLLRVLVGGGGEE